MGLGVMAQPDNHITLKSKIHRSLILKGLFVCTHVIIINLQLIRFPSSTLNHGLAFNFCDGLFFCQKRLMCQAVCR
jgi:hypothetical protein